MDSLVIYSQYWYYGLILESSQSIWIRGKKPEVITTVCILIINVPFPKAVSLPEQILFICFIPKIPLPIMENPYLVVNYLTRKGNIHLMTQPTRPEDP